jgi:hypothetical protein
MDLSIIPVVPKKRSICIKTWTTKNGEVKTKEYDQTKYSHTHYINNKDKYTQKIKCDCGIDYCISNKRNHKLSRIHRLYETFSNVPTQ